jgi:hypothetical protein
MTNSNENTDNREYEEGAAGTNKNRKSDPLKEFEQKEPMTRQNKCRKTNCCQQRSC